MCLTHILNFNTKDQQKLEFVQLDEAKKYFADGQFASGSMGPKISAAINFVENGGKETIITEATQLQKY